MRATSAALLLLASGFFLADESHAQQPDSLSRVPPEVASAFLPDSAYAAALDAAAVDPGILIFPDSSAGVILRLTPPKNIDPEMIVPDGRERNGEDRRR